MATKKGRPQKNNNNIMIHDINVEYSSTNTDRLDNSIVYFKLTDPKSTLKPSIDTQANDKDVKVSHICVTDTQDVILKVKSKWLNICDELQPSANYVMNADFSSYSMDTDNGDMRGYYIKVIKIKKKKWMLY